MQDRRIYQRYTVSDDEHESSQVDIKMDGIPVQLVDFSFGGLCVISEKSYAKEDIVKIFVNFVQGGQIDLVGKVVRVAQEEKSWTVAVDLSGNYKLDSLRKS